MSSAEQLTEPFILGRAVILGEGEEPGGNTNTIERLEDIFNTFGEERIDPALTTILEKADTEAVHSHHNDGRGGYSNTERLIVNVIKRRHLASTHRCHVIGADIFDSEEEGRSFVGLTFDEKGLQVVRSARGMILNDFNLPKRPMSRNPFVRVAMEESGYARYIAGSISELLKEPLGVTIAPDYFIEPSEEN